MSQNTPEPVPEDAPLPAVRPSGVWPGLAVCGAIGLMCIVIGRFAPNLSPMLVAIVLGIAIRNLAPVPTALEPGIAVAAKRVLRWGVVLLGLQVSFSTILGLGTGVLAVVCCAVGLTFGATLALGRLLGIDDDLGLLIASGFSICGAAAVAGMQGAIRAGQEKVAAAVALVVLYGTLMIPVGPALIGLLGLDAGDGGTLIGGSTHEVAQVVAAAGVAGGDSLMTVAVTIKLARVALMAPVVAGAALMRNSSRRAEACGTAGRTARRPPILPLFVVGFIAMMALATVGVVPSAQLARIKLLQQFLLTTAMFALGLGVHVKSLMRLGLRPVLLGLCSTLVILAVVLVGVALGAGARV